MCLMSGAGTGSFSGPDRALMVVSDVAVRGSTRMQKYGFLLAMQYKKETGRISKAEPSLKFYDDWEPLWFGPFSKSLADDIDCCVERGLMRKEPITMSPDSYMYSFTINGRAQWRKMADSFGGDMTAIREKVAHLQRISLESLLEGIYSAYPEYTENSVIKDRIGGG